MADESNRSGEFAHLSEANRRVWDANARWWDDEIGDGNDFQDELIEPAREIPAPAPKPKPVKIPGAVELGVFEPKEGKFILRFEVIGSNARATGAKTYAGLDCVVLAAP